MKIYTKTGDNGETSLYGGERVSKNHERIDAYGDVDELNAFVGLLRSSSVTEQTDAFLKTIQEELFVVGAVLATPANMSKNIKKVSLSDDSIKAIENEIDLMNAALPAMTHFILPSGSKEVSYCHVCRTVTRRAERKIIKIQEKSLEIDQVIVYMNRLSDFFFVLARKLTMDNQIKEDKWIP